MTADIILDEVIGEIRRIYADDPQTAPDRIEAYLQQRLADHPSLSATDILEKIVGRLEKPTKANVPFQDSELIARVFTLLLGRKVEPEDLSSAELLDRLAQSMNTIFNSLNELVSVINMTFTGEGGTGEQTIRQFIRFHLEAGDQTQPLEEYIGQINQAFLTTQKAFKKAARTKVEQILKAIDPDALASERSGGLKLGPLRKAEDFDILKHKIERIRRWYDKGQFMEDFLREFERNCQAFENN